VPPAPDCWLHPDVEVGRSPISGHGLFATAPIPSGTVVSRLGGRLVSTAALRDLFTAAARDPGHPDPDPPPGISRETAPRTVTYRAPDRPFRVIRRISVRG
jgi:hypothetical protein